MTVQYGFPMFTLPPKSPPSPPITQSLIFRCSRHSFNSGHPSAERCPYLVMAIGDNQRKCVASHPAVRGSKHSREGEETEEWTEITRKSSMEEANSRHFGNIYQYQHLCVTRSYHEMENIILCATCVVVLAACCHWCRRHCYNLSWKKSN